MAQTAGTHPITFGDDNTHCGNINNSFNTAVYNSDEDAKIMRWLSPNRIRSIGNLGSQQGRAAWKPRDIEDLVDRTSLSVPTDIFQEAIEDLPLASPCFQFETPFRDLPKTIDAKIMRWLSPLGPENRHNTMRADRFEGFGNWLLETSEFREWRGGEGGDDKAALFCFGNPGVGKTHL